MGDREDEHQDEVNSAQLYLTELGKRLIDGAASHTKTTLLSELPDLFGPIPTPLLPSDAGLDLQQLHLHEAPWPQAHRHCHL